MSKTVSMRRALLAGALLLTVTAAPALAAELIGTGGADVLSGGDQDDSLMGGLGPDKLSGGADGDLIYDDYNEEGGPKEDASKDIISGGPGDDAIGTYNDPGVRDVVGCGPGYDTVFFADETDLISADCEEVDRGR